MISEHLFNQWIAAMQSGEYRHYKGEYFRGKDSIRHDDYALTDTINAIKAEKCRCAIGVLARITEHDVLPYGIGQLEDTLGGACGIHVSEIVALSDDTGNYRDVINYLLQHKDSIVGEA